MQKLTLLLLLLWGHRMAAAQPENSNWHFGLQAAVSFTSGVPIVLKGLNALTTCSATPSPASNTRAGWK